MTPKVFWSDEDGCYIAIMPDVPEFRLLSTFGDTEQAALDEFAIVLKAVKEIYQEDGLPWPLDGRAGRDGASTLSVAVDDRE